LVVQNHMAACRAMFLPCLAAQLCVWVSMCPGAFGLCTRHHCKQGRHDAVLMQLKRCTALLTL
jgi:hypothetical protein